MGVTIKDVAEKAGVSVSTVSRVLNKKGIVTPEKERPVLQAIETLHFSPSSIAQSLKHKRTNTIGLLVSDFSVPFFPGVLRVLEAGAMRDGYQILSSNFYDSGETEAKLIENMVRSRVDVLIVNTSGENDERLCGIQESGTPVLSYDRHPKNHEFPAVYVDKTEGIYSLLSYLHRLGHRRFCFISGPRTLSTNIDRQAGIDRFKRDFAVPDDCFCCCYQAFNEGWARQSFRDVVYGPYAPTAFITGSVSLASGIMQYCSNHGIRIPEDISLASFGTFAHANLIKPTLVHVDDEYRTIGDQLLAWVHEATSEGKSLSHSTENVIPPRLILGDSCGVPRVGELHRKNL